VHVKVTGRVLAEIGHDLHTIRETLRATPVGLLSYPTPGPGRPLMFRMPHPLHPLETIAALRGWGGLEGPNLLREGMALMWAGENRTEGGWYGVTGRIAAKLFVPPATVRLLWHVLTPLNVPAPEKPEDAVDVDYWRWDLYAAAGFDPYWPVNPGTPLRPNFWGHETAGDVEL